MQVSCGLSSSDCSQSPRVCIKRHAVALSSSYSVQPYIKIKLCFLRMDFLKSVKMYRINRSFNSQKSTCRSFCVYLSSMSQTFHVQGTWNLCRIEIICIYYCCLKHFVWLATDTLCTEIFLSLLQSLYNLFVWEMSVQLEVFNKFNATVIIY